MVGHVEVDVVVAQAGEQRQFVGQGQTVFRE
jgi:hypothetical protein